MKRYVTEAIGTFFLVFSIGMTAVLGTAGAPLAIGATLMVMVYMGGHVSGAHYNPAVTLGVLLRGAMETSDVLPYMLAQILGAFVAAESVYLITGATFAPAPGDGFTLGPVLLSEFLMTFALVLVVLNVATAEATKGNSYYGLAIGFTVLAGAFMVGPVSGGAFNPAVGVGPAIVDTLAGDGSLANTWYYLVGPFLGGGAAAAVFQLQNGTTAAE